MAEKEKRTILDMRVAGKQYKEISAKLGIDVSALKVFVHRQKHNDVKQYVQCKKVLPKDARKPQRFAGSTVCSISRVPPPLSSIRNTRGKVDSRFT